MVIYGVYIVSKSGGLIFNHDHNVPKVESECVFNKHPMDLKLVNENKKVVVSFGNRDGVAIGHVLTFFNGIAVTGCQLDDGRDVFEALENPANYPLTLKFARPRVTTNEKIFLASMFYPLFALASQLSPETKSSGIEVLEADTFKLQCFQTLTASEYFHPRVVITGQKVLISSGSESVNSGNSLALSSRTVNSKLPNSRTVRNLHYEQSSKYSINPPYWRTVSSCDGVLQNKRSVKFMIVSEPGQVGLDVLLKKIYELYADYALKNPFYSLDMPIRCELFENNLQALLEQTEKGGNVSHI